MLSTEQTAHEEFRIRLTINDKYPALPALNTEQIIKRTSRDGDSELAKAVEKDVDEVVRMAVSALGRHEYTNHDGLSKAGINFADARDAVQESINMQIFRMARRGVGHRKEQAA